MSKLRRRGEMYVMSRSIISRSILVCRVQIPITNLKPKPQAKPKPQTESEEIGEADRRRTLGRWWGTWWVCVTEWSFKFQAEFQTPSGAQTSNLKPQTPNPKPQTPNGVRGDRRSRSTKDSGAVVGGVVGAIEE